MPGLSNISCDSPNGLWWVYYSGTLEKESLSGSRVSTKHEQLRSDRLDEWEEKIEQHRENKEPQSH